MPTEAEVLDALRGVIDPELHRSIVDLDTVRVRVNGSTVDVEVGLVTDEYPEESEHELHGAVIDALGAVSGVREVNLAFADLGEDVAAALMQRLHAPGVPFAEENSRTRVLLVSSGKGGVGKSSVTVNLAVALSQRGSRVAIVDADVYGFSIPAMLGIDQPPVVVGERVVLPPRRHGVRLASIGFFVPEDQPVIWRGPMLHKALEQFLTDFYWGDPDYLVVDMPPGTGDISLSLAQFLPGAEAYVVTTPQPAAQRVAQRAGTMFQNQNIRIPVRGVIENMAWFTGDDGKRYPLFGEGGGQLLAERLDVPLIGRVPLVPALREGGDTGTPITVSEPDGEAAKAFGEVADWIVANPPTKRRNPALKLA
ncbi:MAG TPA: Mrp/NBP35 family ATP-binding protein [Acidimicrobiales bacterium]|nr:Mrp/NBP35 family ATP-binding protein [Acidimicrobiales bacterium]